MDNVLNAFLSDTLDRALRFEDDTTVLKIHPDPTRVPPARYLLFFREVEYLSLDSVSGVVRPSRGPVPVEIRFPADYLRSTDPKLYMKIATVLDPATFAPGLPGFFHPNCDPASGAICLGAGFPRGARLDVLVHHVYDIVAFHNYGVVEWDCLHATAARYLRENPQAALSLRNPPLARRSRKFTVSVS
jgi:hypothetical protein